jgi:hypothetical protein
MNDPRYDYTHMGDDRWTLRSDYGELIVDPIESGNDLWCIVDALIDDKSKFVQNIPAITDYYAQGQLYGLFVSETDAMFKRCARSDPIFCRNSFGHLSFYLLPCFCCVNEKDGDRADIIWAHSKLRHLGLEKTLIKLLDITDVPESP